MGVKFGKAFGCDTSVISRGNHKKENSINDLKADYFLDSTNEVDMEACKGTFDFILCTIAADFDPAPYLNLLKFDGTMVIVGVSFSLYLFIILY
jgi:D-arabinose 1-dehydrogenase-like Zn-dependent alcohol dehydrogenase